MTKIFTLQEIDTIAREIINTPHLKKVICFYADMGVGKTTLIKAITKTLGVTDNSNSPTFSLVNEYETKQGDILYHFDLYRLKNEEEAYDIGIDDYFYSDNWCFIEWPEKTPNLIPINHTSISLTLLPDGKRKIVVKS